MMFRIYEELKAMTTEEYEKYKKEIKEKSYFIRTKVHYYDFVTGLTSALNGGKTSDGIDMDVILSVSCLVPSGDNSFNITGHLFECMEFLSWINGTYDAKKLKELNSPDGFTKPTKFTIEVWEIIDKTQSKNTSMITFEGVEWKEAYHSGDGGDRCCAGIANFTYKNMYEIPCNGETITTGSKSKLKDILKKQVYKGTMLENKL